MEGLKKTESTSLVWDCLAWHDMATFCLRRKERASLHRAGRRTDCHPQMKLALHSSPQLWTSISNNILIFRILFELGSSEDFIYYLTYCFPPPQGSLSSVLKLQLGTKGTKSAGTGSVTCLAQPIHSNIGYKLSAST
ncbi:hypothetical protein WAI453_011406 [Rhynchosporium graminicola]